MPLCDLELRKPGPGRFRADGESIPLLRLSATTALKEDDKGDSNGPGVNLAIDVLDNADGRLLFETESRA